MMAEPNQGGTMEKTFRYKLTDENMETHGKTRWTIGRWKETNGEDELCGPGWLHCYTHPLLAAFLNPIHADFTSPRLFKCEVRGESREDAGMKEGWTEMRLVERMRLRHPTVTQFIKFGILCALETEHSPKFALWAQNWLSGADRTKDSASANMLYALSSSRQAAGAAVAINEGDIRHAIYYATWAAELASEKKKIDLVKHAKEALKN
jgi:hypothetical protein